MNINEEVVDIRISEGNPIKKAILQGKIKGILELYTNIPCEDGYVGVSFYRYIMETVESYQRELEELR